MIGNNLNYTLGGYKWCLYLVCVQLPAADQRLLLMMPRQTDSRDTTIILEPADE